MRSIGVSLTDRKSTRLNSSHSQISYAVFCLKKKAAELGARLVEVDTDEVELEAYRRNNPDRCFHCKEELFGTLEPIRQELGLERLAYGATAGDEGDHRPGHGSALRRGVRFPLLEAGIFFYEIRPPPRSTLFPYTTLFR